MIVLLCFRQAMPVALRLRVLGGGFKFASVTMPLIHLDVPPAGCLWGAVRISR